MALAQDDNVVEYGILQASCRSAACLCSVKRQGSPTFGDTDAVEKRICDSLAVTACIHDVEFVTGNILRIIDCDRFL